MKHLYTEIGSYKYDGIITVRRKHSREGVNQQNRGRSQTSASMVLFKLLNLEILGL